MKNRPAAVLPSAILLACAAWGGCTCGGEQPARRAPPPVPFRPPAPPPSPVVPVDAGPPGPLVLLPAAAPVLSTAVPEGFEREEDGLPEGERIERPWISLRGTAPLDAAVAFYAHYLDPGTSTTAGVTVPGRPGEPAAVPCRAYASRPKPGCRETGAMCLERVCIEQGGAGYLFALQHPRPPGDPAAVVSVRVMPVAGGKVRVTIENQSIIDRLREHAAPEDRPAQPDPTQYHDLDAIPPQFMH